MSSDQSFFWPTFWVGSKTASDDGDVERERVLMDNKLKWPKLDPAGLLEVIAFTGEVTEWEMNLLFEQLQFTAQYYTVNWNQRQVTLI